MPESPQSNNQAVISLQNVSKLFGRFAALREVSADFEPAKAYLVLGENGAGKSTLLRIIAGLAGPTSGNVAVFGAASPADAKARVGYMAHASMLYDELSGMENLRYAAALYGIADDARLAEGMRQVGLDPELSRPAGQYSQGMRQRLSLARALLHNPDVLLLDEPFSNVDTASAAGLVSLLAELRTRGKTILVVTHQAAHMSGVADATLHLSAGKLTKMEGSWA